MESYYIDDERKFLGTAFEEVASFIEVAVMNATNQIQVFRFSDLMKLYKLHLKKLSTYFETSTYCTQVKHRLLSQSQDMSAYNNKKKAILIFNCDIREALTMATGTNYDEEE